MSEWTIPKLDGPTPELVASPTDAQQQAAAAPVLSDQHIEAILQQLGGLLVDNYGAKVTEVLTNGVCVTLRQRMRLMFSLPNQQP